MVNSKNDEIYFILIEKDMDIPKGIVQLTNIDYVSGTAL
jgi:hypothetical protein